MANDRSLSQNQKSTPLVVNHAWHFLSRLDVTAIIICVVLLMAILGSFLPQLSPRIAANPERLDQWEAGVRARYGSMTDLLVTVGAFSYFRSLIFLAPLGLLAAATLVCTLNRWQSTWRRAFAQPVLCSDSIFDTARHTVKLTAPSDVDLLHILRQHLEQRGFKTRVSEVEATDRPVVCLRGNRNQLAPLATLVTHLAVLLMLLGAVLSNGYGWREELTIEPGETVEVGHESRLAVRNDGFSVVRHPDGSIAGYEAQVAVLEAAKIPKVVHGEVGINEPLIYGSIGIHLHGYQGAEGRTNVTLLVVRDPGYALVIAAGFLLLLGLTVTFNFPHCWVRARIGPDHTLHLAGGARRRLCDFEGEFATLTAMLQRNCPGLQIAEMDRG